MSVFTKKKIKKAIPILVAFAIAVATGGVAYVVASPEEVTQVLTTIVELF